MSEKPTIVIFSGAFHQAACMDTFLKHLRAAGFPAEAHALKTVGNASAGIDDDVVYMKSVLQPHFDAGKDVVFIPHSFAGFPTTVAISGLEKHSREANGQKGGILGVIYMAAFIPTVDETLYQAIHGWQSWHIPKDDEGLLYTRDHVETFYADCDPAIAQEMSSTLQPHSIKALNTTVDVLGWKEYEGRRGYIRCLQDQAIPLVGQDHLLGRSGEWNIKTMDASHSPFLSQPEQLTKNVAEIIAAFENSC